MKLKFMFVIVCLLALNLALAETKVDCKLKTAGDNSTSNCLVSLTPENLQDKEYLVTRTIDLKPSIKSFKKLLAKQFNKNECEKKVFIKSAKLQINSSSLKVDVRARLNRLYCKRRARQQVYEKTDGLSYSIVPKIVNNRIEFIDKNANNKASFEKSFSDVLGSNIKDKLNDVLHSILKIDIKNLNIGTVPVDIASIEFKSVKIDNQTKSLVVEMLTNSPSKIK